MRTAYTVHVYILNIYYNAMQCETISRMFYSALEILGENHRHIYVYNILCTDVILSFMRFHFATFIYIYTYVCVCVCVCVCARVCIYMGCHFAITVRSTRIVQ